MFNKECIILKNNISEELNSSHLPPVVAYFILKDILNDLEKVCQEAIQQESKHDKEEQIKGYLDLETGQISQKKILKKQSEDQEEA